MSNSKISIGHYQNIMIGVITIIFWGMAAYGWKQAFIYANETYYFQKEINNLSFLSTLWVLPLPYGAFHLFDFLARRKPNINRKTMLDSFISSTIIVVLVGQGIIAGLVALIWVYGGGLDLMNPLPGIWPVSESLPVATPITLITYGIFSFCRKQKYVYWMLLPAAITNGILFFMMVYVQWWMQ